MKLLFCVILFGGLFGASSCFAVSSPRHIGQYSQETNRVKTEAALRAEIFFNLKTMKSLIRMSRNTEWRQSMLNNVKNPLTKRKK